MQYRCSACDSPEHNYRTCPAVYGPTRPTRRTGSRSQRAAMLAAAERLTLGDVAARFGVTPQAVSRAWRRLYGNTPTPLVAEELRRNEAFLSAQPAGVEPLAQRYTVKRWNAAVAAVAAGASIGEAAADYRVSYTRLQERCQKLGVSSTASGRRAYGAGQRAAELVIAERVTAAEAARRMRVSPSAVRAALARRAA